MNWNEKEEMKDRLKARLAGHITRRGRIISDRERSNAYCGVRIIEADWMGYRMTIFIVDGLVCRIEKSTQ